MTDMTTLALAYCHAQLPDLTIRQFAVLGLVCDPGGAHEVKTLAARLGVTKPVITRAVNTLAALGLMTRRPHPSDARRVIIEPTAQGRQFRAMIASLSRPSIARAA